jgi:hypothetical protein
MSHEAVMSKRCRTWLLLIALTSVALVVYFEPSHCVRGWLWGEAFFDGRPTSYWRVVVEDEIHPRKPNWVDWVQKRLGRESETPGTILLIQNSNSELVLRALSMDDDETIARFAKFVLTWHENNLGFQEESFTYGIRMIFIIEERQRECDPVRDDESVPVW